MADLAATALSTVAEVKSALSIDSGVTTYDGTIARLINAASDWFTKQIGRSLHRATVTEKFGGTGNERIVLARKPLVSITSISFQGTALDADDYEIDDADAGTVLKIGSTWMDSSLSVNYMDPRLAPGTGRKDYTAVYVGGYILPQTGATRTLPADIEEAIIEIAASKYRALGRDRSITSESVLSYSASFGNSSELSPFVESVINTYRVML